MQLQRKVLIEIHDIMECVFAYTSVAQAHNVEHTEEIRESHFFALK